MVHFNNLHKYVQIFVYIHRKKNITGFMNTKDLPANNKIANSLAIEYQKM